MPGYRTLSTHLTGLAAEQAREAELRQRCGDAASAARLLEEALEASLLVRPEMPGWLCGRLASVYRSLKRYDDEVLLLERYRESQDSEEARTRFDARLSKARAIAERKRRPETMALETVRQVRHRSSQRRRSAARDHVALHDDRPVAPPQHAALGAALLDLSPAGPAQLRSVLARLCEEARDSGAQMEDLVATLKRTWSATHRPEPLDETEWRDRYSAALVDLLALYFGDS
jgi:hypothetical protein